MYFWKYTISGGKDENWYHESGKHKISPTLNGKNKSELME